MSRLPALLTAVLLRAYPRAWRRRYGHELLELMAEMDAGPADVIDVLRAGLGQRLHGLTGGPPVVSRTNPVLAAVAACAAVVIAAPTAAFMLANLAPAQLEWMRGVPMPLGGSGLEWVLPALPLVAFLVAVAPALRVSVARPQDGGLAVGIRLHALPRAATVVAILCAALVIAVIAYGVSERILEARA